jgi:hypothetical protein
LELVARDDPATLPTILVQLRTVFEGRHNRTVAAYIHKPES